MLFLLSGLGTYLLSCYEASVQVRREERVEEDKKKKMVVVHVKAAESEEFLYECPSSSTIDEIADSICDIATLQSKIHTLSRLLRRRALTDDAFRGTC